MNVKFKRLRKFAKIPKRGSEFAGGWDVTATHIDYIFPNTTVCYLGFAATPPPEHKITIVPRSNLTKTNWVLQNSPCLGDEDYTGEYMLIFKAIPIGINENKSGLLYEDFPYLVGDRIAQMYIEPVLHINFIEVDELDTTKRSSGGFGSTGLN